MLDPGMDGGDGQDPEGESVIAHGRWRVMVDSLEYRSCRSRESRPYAVTWNMELGPFFEMFSHQRKLSVLDMFWVDRPCSKNAISS